MVSASTCSVSLALLERYTDPKITAARRCFLIIIGQLDCTAARIYSLLKPERHRFRSANPLILPGLA
jgi:hypothetical protein